MQPMQTPLKPLPSCGTLRPLKPLPSRGTLRPLAAPLAQPLKHTASVAPMTLPPAIAPAATEAEAAAAAAIVVSSVAAQAAALRAVASQAAPEAAPAVRQRQATTTAGRPTRGEARSARDRKQATSYLSVDQQGVPSVLLLVPGSPKLLAWEVVSFCLLMYVAVAVPFQMAFVRRVRWDLTQWATYWETGVDGFFIADIVRNCFTAYYDRGTLILDQRKIIRHYMCSWFFIDFVASFPLDWFVGFVLSEEEEGGQSQLLLLLRLSKLWKLVRLLRLWRVGLRSQLGN